MATRQRLISSATKACACVVLAVGLASPADGAPGAGAGTVEEPPATTALSDGTVETVDDLSTEASTTVRNEDGTYTASIYTEPINYQDADGDWRPIDNEFDETAGSRYAATASGSDYAFSIPEDPSTTPIKFETGAAWVSMKLVGSDSVSPKIEGSEASFEDLVPNADRVILEATNAGLKETLILNTPPDEPVTFRYDLATSPGLTPTVTPENTVEFRNQAGETLVSVPVPNMTDSAAPEPAYTNDLTLSLVERDQGWRLAVSPDHEWLVSSDRVYPVAIDPSLSSDRPDQKDCWIRSDDVDANRCRGDYTYAGYAESHKRRALLDFSFKFLPIQAKIESSQLRLWLNGNMNVGVDGPNGFSVYQPKSYWGDGVTWSTAKNYAWGGGSTGTVLSNTISLGSATNSGWVSWDVTGATRGWQNGNLENRGLMVRANDETHRRRVSFIGSANSAHPDLAPVLRVTYSVNDTTCEEQFDTSQGLLDGWEVSETVARSTGAGSENQVSREINYGSISGEDAAVDLDTSPVTCDVSGRICVLGMGHCGWEIPRHSGSLVHVSYGIQDKINNDHEIPDWIISRAIMYGHRTYSFVADGRRTAYRFTLWEWECNSACVTTGRKVEIDHVIDWYDGKKNHGFLTTMFCRGYSGSCPSWVWSDAPYLGTPGPQTP